MREEQPIIESQPTYSLQELLDQCDASAVLPDDDSQWAASASVGKELI
ncbi:MAG: hypothetical protein LBV80_00105 [Deltaproteobacteria bacterium]|jgi:antitoxin ChpS|nr:hypothetical protein [Deltaproteobacteria bacterium]